MEEILNKKNVIGTAEGEKWINNQRTGEKAILVFVDKKLPEKILPTEEIIEKEICGKPTDVVGKCGIIKALRSKMIRPVLGGISISSNSNMAGTLGGIFKDKDGDIVGLTNNHVIINQNTKIGDPVYQPGGLDRRVSPRAIIGHIKDFVKLNNNIDQDSAIIKLTAKYINSIDKIKIPKNWKHANYAVDISMMKSGRSTGLTYGKIIGLNGTFKINYGKKLYTIKNCMITQNMGNNGDSGSLLLRKDNMKIAGLLFAGSNKLTLHNPIDPIIKRYGLTVL